MKQILSVLMVFILIAMGAGPVMAAPLQQTVIPTITIVSVDPGVSVTIRTQNYPANDNFDVLMNYIGTRGVGGTKVQTVNSGAGGTQTFTFNIPDFLKNERLVAIRLQSPTSGYFSYNWFVNQSGGSNTPGVPPTGHPPAGAIPTISITSVDPGVSVTIQTQNYPANDNFDVLMNVIGTRGVGGTKVATVNSGTGGTQTFTFNIPENLRNNSQIAIRLQSPTSGYFSYNWFYNRAATTPGVPTTGGTIPTFSIQAVVRDGTVTIQTRNFPANDTFNVLMGDFGTRGVNGVSAGTVNSGTGGTQTFTINIPDGVKGKDRIAIRLESPTSGYFAYNWFWNNTTP